MKRQATSERRVQFENARRILFGTELIPGTNRERWTTAGMFEFSSVAVDHFTLGPYQFELDGNVIFLNNVQIVAIYRDHLKIWWPHLTKEIFSSNLRKRVDYRRISFQHENKIYFNIAFEKDINRSFFGAQPPVMDEKILPTDDTKLLSYYKKTKNITEVDFELKIDDFTMISIPHKEIPEGIVKYQDFTCVFSAGLVGLQVGVTGVVPWKHVTPRFSEEKPSDICEFDTGKFWYYAEIAYIARAIDWLMHVLTGPDPRNYGARNFDHPEIPLKEDSEPKKRHFTFEKDEYGIYHMKGEKYPRFFVLEGTIIEAKLIRNTVTRYLIDRYGVKNLGHALEVFKRGDMKDAPYTVDEFNAAIARIDRFDQYEYLGCVVCGENGTQKCGNCNQIVYCGEECQKVHWEHEHFDECLR